MTAVRVFGIDALPLRVEQTRDSERLVIRWCSVSEHIHLDECED